MKTKEEINKLLKDISGELNIIRAGFLAKIRILDHSISILQNNPEFFNDQHSVLNNQLEYRTQMTKNSELLSSKIEELKTEIDTLSPSTNEVELMIRVFRILYMD